jgi:hypothetical protein
MMDLIRSEKGAALIRGAISRLRKKIDKNRKKGTRQAVFARVLETPKGVVCDPRLTTARPKADDPFLGRFSEIWDTYDPATTIPVLCIPGDAPTTIMCVVTLLEPVAAAEKPDPLPSAALDSHHRAVAGPSGRSAVVRPKDIFGRKKEETQPTPAPNESTKSV